MRTIQTGSICIVEQRKDAYRAKNLLCSSSVCVFHFSTLQHSQAMMRVYTASMRSKIFIDTLELANQKSNKLHF